MSSVQYLVVVVAVLMECNGGVVRSTSDWHKKDDQATMGRGGSPSGSRVPVQQAGDGVAKAIES